MEKGFAFLPPGVVTQESYQNSMIRALKTNSLPHPYEHRSCTVNTPTSYSQSLLFFHSHRFGALHIEAHIRRRHFRRIYDLVHVCMLRRKVELAARFLRVLIQSHEWNHDIEWRMGLLLVALTPEASFKPSTNVEDEDASTSKAKLKMLTALDLSTTYHFKATRLTEEMVVEHIAANTLAEAIELLESRVQIWPYKNQPSLHCYLGMLYLFVGVQKLLATHQQSADPTSTGVDMRKLDRNTRNKCRDCFTQVLYSTTTWMTLELRRRQRIYYMYRKDLDKSKSRSILMKRERAWGIDPLQDIPDLSDDPVIHDGLGAEDMDPDVTVVPDPPAAEDSRASVEVETPPPEELDETIPTRGPSVWPKYWPEVEDTWQVEKPWAWYVAREYLDLLFPGNNFTAATHSAAARRATEPVEYPTELDNAQVRHVYVDNGETGSNAPVESGAATPKRKRERQSQAPEKSASKEPKRKSRSRHADTEAHRGDPQSQAFSGPSTYSSASEPVAVNPSTSTAPQRDTRRKSKPKKIKTKIVQSRTAVTPRGF